MAEASRPMPDALLTESEERYRAVIENASDMIQSIRPDGTFEFVNRAWHLKLGYSTDDVEKLIIWDVIHPSSLEHCQTLFAQVMEGNPAENVRVTFQTKDGRALPAEGSATTRLVDGQIIATHAFFRDITERLRAEELEERNAQLELERHARYLEKMAALGKLSAGLAHELNNPAAAAQRSSVHLLESLRAVDSSVRALTMSHLSEGQDYPFDSLPQASVGTLDGPQLDPIEQATREEAIESWLADHGIADPWELAPTLVRSSISPGQLDRLARQVPESAFGPVVRCMAGTLSARDLAHEIVICTRQISELVTAVKAYSFMDRSLEQSVDIHEGLENTMIIMGHRMKDVQVSRDYDRSLPEVSTLGSSLNQVWTNIIDNAVDAVGGTGSVTIRTRRQGGSAVVEIEDDGQGIPAVDLPRIFEPFFTTKPQGQGTGLGLNTAWRIVTEQHGGTIDVESEPGRTLFQVAIPLVPGSLASRSHD